MSIFLKLLFIHTLVHTHTARSLFRHLQWRYEGIPWPSVTLPTSDLQNYMTKRINEASVSQISGFYPLLFQFHSYSCSIPVPIPFPFQLHFCPNPILVPIPCCCLDIKFILHLFHPAPISWCKSAIILLPGG